MKMKRIVAFFLAVVMAILSCNIPNETEAAVSMYFGFESITMDVKDGQTSFDVNYYVRGNSGFDQFNMLNVNTDLAAYGFTEVKGKGGRPSNDLEAIVVELISRYEGERFVESIDQLKEENSDLAPKFKSIQNKSILKIEKYM